MSFVVPTIFTAVDRFTPPMMRMMRTNQSFALQTEIAAARANRVLNSLSPTLNGASKEFFAFAKSAAVIGAVTKLFYDTKQALGEYEINVQNFRGIVSDLTKSEFERYKKQLNEVAVQTRESAGQTFFAAEKIAALNEEFARTPAGMVEMTKQAIILARASDGQLGPAAENLVGIMNQFDLQATQAARTANVLAAGEQVGAASITQSAEAYKNFGAVAASANVTLEESQALIQTLGKFMVLGSEAGTGLKASIIRLQKAGLGYASGQFDINDALNDARERMMRYKTEKQRDSYVTKVFGMHQENIGRILLNNTELFRKFTTQVTGTSAAQELAAIKTDTVTEASRQLWNEWTNLITTSDATNSGMRMLIDTLKFLTRNLDTIIYITGTLIGLWVTSKIVVTAVNAALWVHYTTLGLVAGAQGKMTRTVATNTAMLRAYRVALIAVRYPMLSIGVAAAGLVIALALMNREQSMWSIKMKINSDIQDLVIDKTIQQRAEVEKLFGTLKSATVGTNAYHEALRKVDRLQPGIVDKYELEKGAIDSLNNAHRELIKTIEERARVQAISELYTQTVKERIKLEQQRKELSQEFLSNPRLHALTFGAVRSTKTKKELDEVSRREAELLRLMTQSDNKAAPEAVNPQATQWNAFSKIFERTNNAKVTIDNKTDYTVKTDNPEIVTVNLGPTYGP